MFLEVNNKQNELVKIENKIKLNTLQTQTNEQFDANYLNSDKTKSSNSELKNDKNIKLLFN